MDQKEYDAADNSLTQLVNQIAEKTGWGAIKNWSERDFIALSDLLERTTNERVSVTTLKRATGRISRKSLPHLRTLDSLAKFAGYQDWNDYLYTLRQEPEKKPEIEAHPVKQNKVFNTIETQHFNSMEKGEPEENELHPDDLSWFQSKAFVLILIGFVLISVIYIFSLNRTVDKLENLTLNTAEIPDEETAADIIKSGQMKITDSNFDYDKNRFTVNLEYYLPELKPANLNVIRFDDRLTYLNANSETKQGTARYTYRKPGIYMVKIFSNNKTLGELPIVIPTKDWMARVRFADEAFNDFLFDARQTTTEQLAQLVF